MSLNLSEHYGDGEKRPTANTEVLLKALLEQAQHQTQLLEALRSGGSLDACLLEKIGRIACMTANETHHNSSQLAAVVKTLSELLAMYRSVHPEQALQLDRLAKLEAQMLECCPPKVSIETICRDEPCQPYCGVRRGDGYSVKSRGSVPAIQASEGPHEPWTIRPHGLNEDDEVLPQVGQGPLVGAIVPVAATPHVLDFRSGGSPAPAGAQEPVTFRTFSESGVSTGVWPPDMSGAKAGDVVVMSGNLWLKLSVDSGKTFTDLKFTDLFAADKTYGGWAGDQVIHYSPSIDCFVLYVQSAVGAKGTANQTKSVVKVALASPADLKKFKGAKAAWRRQWDFTSDDFGLNAWLDFPDITIGTGFLYINTNAFARSYDSAGKAQNAFAGKLFFELRLSELKAGGTLNFSYAVCTDNLSYGSPTQNIGDENYWAAHIDNSALRIYSSKGGDPNFQWRERKLNANWPLAALDANKVRDIVSSAPDSGDWISEDHRIIGATRVNNQLWFAWSAAKGDGGAGGFSFPQPHVQIAKFDLNQDYKLVEQSQIWNADVAFAYPSLTTNSNNEVGISLAWGGGKSFGSHAVGIFGDFVMWFGEASDRTSTVATPTRFGDYLHVRLAHPDTRFFSAFGYAVRKDATLAPPERVDYLYVEFGREAVPASPLH
jgi:hypothetical protein